MDKQAEANRLEQLLTKIKNGESPSGEEGLNRLEHYLLCILANRGIEELGEPLNRLEFLLQSLYGAVSSSPNDVAEIVSARLEEI